MADYIAAAGVNFEVRRNRSRKRVTLGLDGDGLFYIGAPLAATLGELRAIAEENAPDFVKRFSGRTAVCHSYAEGELFYLRGERFPLRYTDERWGSPLKFTDGCFVSHRLDEEAMRHNFRAWYSHRLSELVHEELPPLCKKMGVGPRTVHIKEVRTLWGSCSRSSSVTFNIKLALVPPALMNYVMIHELCHFYEMNHSPAFWKRVAEFCPGYVLLRAELKRDGGKYRW